MNDPVGALLRSVHFIAWSNFVDVGVLGLWLRSLVLLATACAVAWAAGHHACRALKFSSPSEQFVLTLASGLAVLAVTATVLVLVGLYTWWAASALCLVLLASAGRAVISFPKVLRRVVADAPIAATFAVLLSMQALLPPYRWDEVSYHLAYPQQWVLAGHVTLDPHLAYPLYTLTWQALLGLALMAGSTSLAHLLSWLTGVLAAWCVALFLERLGARAPVIRVARVALLLTPAVLAVLDVALIDVPIMCFLTVGLYALFALRDQTEIAHQQTIPAALCGAMFVGLKITNILYLPLLLVVALYRLPRRPLLMYVAILAVASSPWYVRNWLTVGDPLTPLIAHMRGHTAPYWSSADLAGQAADLRRGLSYSASALLALPVRVLTSTMNGPLRGPPLLGYALLLPSSVLLFRRLRASRALDLLGGTWYAVAAWVGTTYLIRYAYWVPLAIVCSALVVDTILRRLPASWRRLDWAVAALLLIGPTPASLRYVKDAFHDSIPLGASDRRSYAFGGCADECAFGAVIARATPGARIYTLAPPMTYYWQQASFHVASSAFHPGGFGEFDAALKRGTGKAFLLAAGVDYLVLDDRYANTILDSTGSTMSERIHQALGAPLWSDSVEAVFAIPTGSR